MDMRSGAILPSWVDDLAVGIMVHEPTTGAILDVNEPLERLYGYAAAELRTMSIEEYTAPSTKFSQEEAVVRIRAAADGDIQSFEWQIERSDGELRWVNVRLTPTTIDDTPCVLAEITDITGYRNRERRLRLLNRIVRHNLRNDMTVLMGYADRLKRAVKEETLEEEVETILEIAAEVGRMSESIRQLQEIVGTDTAQRSPTNIRDVVLSVVSDVQSDAPEADVTVRGLPDAWVSADRGLHYAIEHAVENAIEHNDRETPTVTVRIDAEPDSGPVVIRIADDGPPIPEIETAVLDEDVEISSTYHGSGVGLWVMKWCVDSLGGDLSFEENNPRGNVVSISLPRIDSDARDRCGGDSSIHG